MDSFLSCDWGTSTFRLRLVDAGSMKISGEIILDEGIAEIYQRWQAIGKPETERISFYRKFLNGSIDKLSGNIDKNIPVILSGMVSSSMGIAELPYQEFPFTWDSSQFPVKKIETDTDFTHPLYIVSGFKTDDDVMRGEETQLLGCDVDDDGERIFIFPGTHSKHVFVKNKTGLDFKTYLTGEIFNLLAEKSILHNGIVKGIDEKSFTEGFKAGFNGNILHQVFTVRTRHLLKQKNPVSNYQYLSGVLIGAELSELKENNCPVYLVCSEHLKQSYLLGLELMELKREIIYLDGDVMLTKGHYKIAGHYLKYKTI